ncbi:MAG: hypothetical protein ABSF98_11330 [Bryobacteraceae bacterium]|jgi:hypothetical protein
MIAIPTPILVACAGLFALFCVLLVRMSQQSSRAYRALGTLGSVLRSFALAAGTERGRGLDPAFLDEVRGRCRALPEPCRTWWLGLDENIVTYVSVDGVEGCYLGASPREILREESVSERYYHGSFYQAVPGILTGLGLMLTFISILVALTGLHVSVANGTETVVGIKELIEGLAAKFVSSIIGLALSIAFLLVERKWCERRLSNAYEDLLEAVAHLIPAITATRVQLDVQVLAARQSAALESMNAKIAAFLNMVTVANQSVPRMAAALASDVEQFSDRLEALSDTLNNGIRRLRQ